MPLTDQQNAAVEDLDKSLCVIAGAGTGKTRVLVERFMRLLESGVPLDELAAITFTEAAAAEMLERLRHQCRERADSAADVAVRATWRQHQWELSSQHVSTIHGFCRRIISQHPVELGLDPQFGIIATADQQRTLKEALLDTLQQAAEDADPSLLALSESYSVDTIRRLLGHVVQHRVHLLPLLGLCDQPTEELVGRWLDQLKQSQREAIQAALENDDFVRSANLIAAVSGKDDDTCEVLRCQAASLLEQVRQRDDDSWAALRMLSGMGRRKNIGRKTAWASTELLNEVREAIQYVRSTAEALVEPLDFADDEQILENVRNGQHLARLGKQAIERFQNAKKAMSLVDFDDLLLMTDELLQLNPDICQRLGKRYRQILVDELQDTDALQLSILGRLLGCAEDGSFSPRPGSFFGVGDPKQSIYRFRGADVKVFNGIIRSFGRQHTRILTQTFRFHRGLATGINMLFLKVLGRDNFAELDAYDSSNPEHSIELLITLADKEQAPTVDERSELEAAMVCRRIRRLVDDGHATYGQIVLLMQRHKTSYFFEDAFKRCGIPYCVIGGQRFYQQQEIRDATSALRVLRNPGDDLALATVLRSPYFGISDNGLYCLRGSDSLRLALGSEDILARMEPDDANKARRARQWLDHFSHRAGRVGIARLLEEALFETGLAHVTLPQFLGLQRYANLRRLMEMAREHDRSGNLRLEDFLETVEHVMAEAVEESEAPLSEIGDDSIRLMSIHKAKGLEFPHVFLVNCDHDRTGGPGRPVYPASEIGLLPLPPDRLKRQKRNGRTLYDAQVQAERLEEQEEFRRLFYVAATRAQQRLYVCGAVKNEKAATGWLSWMYDNLGLSVEASAECPIEAGEHTIELRDNLDHLATMHVSVSVAEALAERSSIDRVTPVSALMSNGLLQADKLAELRKTTAKPQIDHLRKAVGPIRRRPDLLRLSVTSLADYVRCPALFNFRHVLRLPDLPWPVRAAAETKSNGDAATPASAGESQAAEPAIAGSLLGTLVHDVLAESAAETMEAWQQTARRIVEQSDRVPPELRQEAMQGVNALLLKYEQTSPLPQQLREARRIYRELPFALRLGEAVISGKIDLLYQAADGGWHLVDFKTDRHVPDQQSLESGPYGLQMKVYELAAEKFLQAKLENVCLLFIREGRMLSCRPQFDQLAIEALSGRILAEDYPAQKLCHQFCQFSAVCSAECRQ